MEFRARSSNSDGQFIFYGYGGTTDSEYARIDSSGRLLVGTSSDTTGDTGAKIQIVDTGTPVLALSRNDTSIVSGNTIGQIRIFSNDDSGYQECARIAAQADGDFANDDKPTRLTFSTTADSASSPTERMRIDSSGNVGIGTISPAGSLGVDGFAYFGNQSASGTTDGVLRIGESTSSMYIQTGTNTSTGSSADLVFSNINAANEWMRLTSTGRLGLGTSSPSQKLHLEDSGSNVYLRVTETGNTGIDFGQGTDGNGIINLRDNTDIQILTNGSEKVRIKNDGKVGIGTTSPSSILEASTSVNTSGAIKITNPNSGTGANASFIAHNGTFDAAFGIGGTNYATYAAIRPNAAFIYCNQANGIGFTADNANGFINFVTGGSTERARIDNSGRLLVGTSSSIAQNSALQIATNSDFSDGRNAEFFRFDSSNDTAGPFLYLTRSKSDTIGTNTAVNADDGLGGIRFSGAVGSSTYLVGAQIDASVDSGTVSSTSLPTRLRFTTTADGASSPTERMRINSSGFVLHSNTGAYDNATGNYHQFRSNQTNWTVVASNYQPTDPYGVLIDFDVDQNDTGSPFLYCQGAASLRMQVRSNGGIANFQSNNVNLCDEREKKNIESLDSTWGCLKNWDLKKFHYNEDADTDDKRYGVIAQQVAPHCPEVITEWVKQKAEDAVLDEDGNVVTPAVEEVTRMGVKEQQMMWMAIKALQEAQTRIETLEAEVAALKGA